MAHVSDHMTKAVKKAAREKTRDFKGWTRIVPMEKLKQDRRKSTKHYLQEVE